MNIIIVDMVRVIVSEIQIIISCKFGIGYEEVVDGFGLGVDDVMLFFLVIIVFFFLKLSLLEVGFVCF